jgi:hypothetical protein
MSIVYVGLDLGSSNFQQVALNHDGVSSVYRVFTTSEANLVKAFSDLKGEIHVHLEAGELAPWAASVIAPLVSRVVCSHPQSNAWIARDADLAVQEISVLDFVFHTRSVRRDSSFILAFSTLQSSHEP